MHVAQGVRLPKTEHSFASAKELFEPSNTFSKKWGISMNQLAFHSIVIGIISAATISYAIGDEASGDGPFDANGFVRQQPAPGFHIARKAAARPAAVRPSVVFDEKGNSNQLIVRFNYDRPGQVVNPALLKSLSSDESRADFERAVVDSVVKGGAVARRGVLRGATHARRLTRGMRLSKRQREAYGPDHPREKLEQFIVLTYPTVAAAQRAAERLRRDPAVKWVGMNRRAHLSWQPNDPYFPNSALVTVGPAVPEAGAYQWGMHAMSFPSAWDITRGNAYVGAADTGLPNGVAPADLAPNYRDQFSYAADGWLNNPVPFHGTHVLGIIAAAANNNAGVSGGCPGCSIAIAKALDGSQMTQDSIAQALTRLAESGMQVVNMSFNHSSTDTCAAGSTFDYCNGPASVALELLSRRDVLAVAASGNYAATDPNWPASVATVLSVTGAQNENAAAPSSWEIWMTSVSPTDPRLAAYRGSSAAGGDGVIAPAKAIVSTVPAAIEYNTPANNGVLDCTDNLPFDGSGVAGDGYGTCSGTSMAAPHVSALGGLLRSANPLASAEDIKSVIRRTASNSLSPDPTIGYGMPDAGAALRGMFADGGKNKLTPLFSFYSENRFDSFYTTVPQMAMAALWGTLAPHRTDASPVSFDYVPRGTAIANYPEFPDTPQAYSNSEATPLAEAWIFTTPVNPVDASLPLVPLYRLSWKCEDTPEAPPAICASAPNHTDTVYTTEQAGINAYARYGYKLDGIEGYIYPKTVSPQPPGTERLMRKYNPDTDDHAIFPESRLAEMTRLGYVANSFSDWLGYVYPNTTGIEPAVSSGTVAPSTPTGLSAAAVSNSQVNLSWNAAADDVGVAAYKVYRNGALIATVGNVTSYRNTGLAAATTYRYAVQACGSGGTCSAMSAAVSATTAAGTYSWSCIVAGPLPSPPNEAPNLCNASNVGQAKTIRIYYNRGTSYQDAYCACVVY